MPYTNTNLQRGLEHPQILVSTGVFLQHTGKTVFSNSQAPRCCTVQEAALGELAAIGGSQQLNLPPVPIGLPELDVVILKFLLNALAFRGIC